MQSGIYEQLISKLISAKLNRLDIKQYYIQQVPIDKVEASLVLSRYIAKIIQTALNLMPQENSVLMQIELVNKIVILLRDELQDNDFEDDLLVVNNTILNAVFNKLDCSIIDYQQFIRQIMPATRLTHSELFTGSNSGISLESELRKEILSSDKICFLVSFIKWSGIRIFERELREFTAAGKQLQVITTSYMGATDYKAVEFLASLPNTEVKISYNTKNERLHAKAYLFYRNTDFHTAYIGSSNLSRSALTSGLEWNLKVTTGEVSQLIDKFQKTFSTYWQDPEFETFILDKHQQKLSAALITAVSDKGVGQVFFDIKPFHFQQEILERLEVERSLHHRNKNLLVAATGTGKTVIAAFDFKRFLQYNPDAKLLFIAHRKEILQQARAIFAGVLRNNNFGEMLFDGQEPKSKTRLFANITSLNNRLSDLQISPNYYDFIIIDEVHHIAANSYRPILNYFTPKILLGLTATPERMDGENILRDFDNTIAAEIRLPEALNRKLLTPFQYFAISDSVDVSGVKWQNGRYLPSELSHIYTSNDIRVGEIITKCHQYLIDIKQVRALAFCITKEHAKFMAEKFILAGISAASLVGDDSALFRDEIRKKLQAKEINFLFVVDVFNEGIDIPEIDTVLFLRPTESLTVFLQQLGRGLRLSENKDCLTVLDFVGNSRSEYDFESKFRALIGKTNYSTLEELEHDFPHLPLGCSIVLEKRAREYILSNIKNATKNSRIELTRKITNFKHQSSLSLTLSNFCKFYNLSLESIYRYDKYTWNKLLYEAEIIQQINDINQMEIQRAIYRKWFQCNSFVYLNYILQLAKNNFLIHGNESPEEVLMLNMLYYDLWQEPNPRFNSLKEAIEKIGENQDLVVEIIEVLQMLINRIGHIEYVAELNFTLPLRVHSRYTKDQILAALGESNLTKKSSNREGVLNIPHLNAELLFVTLEKSEEHYSPTTMYNDYAMSDVIFHWQSQNSAREDRGRGLAYTQQRLNGQNILLFVRETNKNQYKTTNSFVFLGKVNYIDHYGSKPMSINWKLERPIPAYLWKDTAKMAVG